MPRNDRYRSLDLARGAAALAVVVFHATPNWKDRPISGASEAIHWLIMQGGHGVQLFFVISGYCITAALAREHRLGGKGGRFLFDRAWRLLPAYWVALTLSMVLAVIATPFNHTPLFALRDQPGAMPADWGMLAAEFLLLSPWVGRSPQLDTSWTLTVECTFYLTCAGFLWLGQRTRSIVLVLVLAVALAIGSVLIPSLALLTPIAHWPAFLCGSALWMGLTFPRTRVWLVALGGPIMIGLNAVALPSAPATLSLAVGFTLILALLHRFDASLANARALGWLRWIGTISYSLYLVHFPLVVPGKNLLARLWPATFPDALGAAFGLTVFAIGAAALFYRFVEAPLERRRKSRKYGASGLAAASELPAT